MESSENRVAGRVLSARRFAAWICGLAGLTGTRLEAGVVAVHGTLVLSTLIVLALMTVGAGSAAGWRSPEQVDGAVTVTVEQAKALFAEGVAFIDVRSPRRYAIRHLPGAHHLDIKNAFTQEALNAIASKNEPIVIYCSGVKCSRSARASALAVSWGYRQVHYFRGGLVAWRDAGLPLELAD